MGQFQFTESHDLRRPSEYPRLSERHRVNTSAIWYPPSRRKILAGRPGPVEIQVLDLSVAGALLFGHANPAIELGLKLKIEFDGVKGVSVIRNIRESASRDMSYYGVSFFAMTHEFELKVMEVVADIRTST